MLQDPLLTEAAVSASRLNSRLSGLAAFGARPDGGVDRQALCPQELAARRWLVEPFLARRGYQIAVDDAANVFVRRQGRDAQAPCVLVGSHIDTQPAGGRYDGAFGVCAGLEALDALDAANAVTRSPVEVVIWNNEEGVRFSPGLTGSGVFTHPERLAGLAALIASDGQTMQDACRQACCDMDAFVAGYGKQLAKRPLGAGVQTYLEAHIEQGPILERLKIPVGCVTGIQAVRWLSVSVRGQSAHAGTTPLSVRDDAMVKAVELAAGILALARDGDDDLRLTIGRWQASPNSINTIANAVSFTVDIRHPDAARVDDISRQINEFLPNGASVEVIFTRPATHFDERIIRAIEARSSALGIPSTRLISGAFHDALNLADLCPTAMIFSPSRRGVSHHPDEFTASEDLYQCTRVLTGCVSALADTVPD
ncbi:M20 family metallo-hydrolase [Brenneria izadpanahii]|uniref:M20 family metallo-hydrolase n=1 Tax=Brenneria izadpanahii TaxID=2722756 RepID=A0ABX7UW90_9GAMM|nr:M20 family metallo-hydrolase [Brenneria izadpanahii]QTF08602.1 M20 family metallo-hydrolase [Brenneria izadpanahii]